MMNKLKDWLDAIMVLTAFVAGPFFLVIVILMLCSGSYDSQWSVIALVCLWVEHKADRIVDRWKTQKEQTDGGPGPRIDSPETTDT